MIHRDVRIADPEGLHALTAQAVAAAAGEYASSVFLRYGGRTASAASAVDLLTLGAACDAVVSVWVDGTDEVAAMSVVAGLLAGETAAGDVTVQDPAAAGTPSYETEENQ